MRVLLPSSVLCALLLLTGCERNVVRADYFPLRDGNRWEYRLLDKPLLTRTAAGQAIVTAPLEGTPGSEPEDEVAPKAEVVGDAFPDEPQQSSAKPALARRVVLELRAGIDDITYRAMYDTAEQVWSKRNGYIGFQSARGRSYLLLLPPHTGYKWVVTAPGGQDLFYEVESTDAVVSTPKQMFADCVVARQESRDRRETFRYWFAPNIGLVRRSKYFAGEEVFRQELVDYAVKPASLACRMAEDREVRRAVEGKNRGNEFRERTLDDPRGRRSELYNQQEEDVRSKRIREQAHPK